MASCFVTRFAIWWFPRRCCLCVQSGLGRKPPRAGDRPIGLQVGSGAAQSRQRRQGGRAIADRIPASRSRRPPICRRARCARRVSDFAGKVAAKGADTVALVFYAGHGLQIDGENFLVPVDVDPKREADIPIQAVRLNDVLNTLTSVPSKMRILLLDACRNNPFPEISKSAGGGLAIIDAKIGAPNTFLSFSTSPGADSRRRHRRRQPVHDRAAGRGQGAEHSDRGNLQARARVGQQGDRGAADAMGQSSSLTEDFRFSGPPRRRVRNSPRPRRPSRNGRAI